MGMLDDLLGAALGGGPAVGASPAPPSPPGLPGGLPNGLQGGSLAALLPVLMSMLGQSGSGAGGGLGGLLGQVLGGGAGGPPGGLSGGLGGLLKQLERAGFGAHAASWVGTGQNQPISPADIGKIFGQGGLADIAQRAGLSPDQASAGLAHLLPAVVDHLTPQGQVPGGNDLEAMLGGLLKRLG